MLRRWKGISEDRLLGRREPPTYQSLQDAKENQELKRRRDSTGK